MSYEKRLVMGIALAITMPAAIVVAINCTRPLSISNLPSSEQKVIRSIINLGINASAGEFGCDFRPRGHLVLSRETEGDLCHVVEFELLPSAVVPVGVKQIVPDETLSKLTSQLTHLTHLGRVVLPGAPEPSVARIHRLLPDCSVSTKLPDARPYSAKVALTSLGSK